MNYYTRLVTLIALGVLLGVFVFFTVTRNAEAGNYSHKVYVCHCEQPDSESPFQCQTLHIDKHAAKRHLQQHDADYKGQCSESTASPEPTETPSSTPSATPVSSPTPEPTITPSPTPLVCQGSQHVDSSGNKCVDFQFGGPPPPPEVDQYEFIRSQEGPRFGPAK